LLWAFIEACGRGKLPFDECSPLFYLVAIGVLLIFAILLLSAMVLRRMRNPARQPVRAH